MGLGFPCALDVRMRDREEPRIDVRMRDKEEPRMMLRDSLEEPEQHVGFLHLFLISLPLSQHGASRKIYVSVS